MLLVGNFSSNILEIVNPIRLYLVDPWFFVKERHAFNRFYGGGKGGSQEKMDEVCDFVVDRFKNKANVMIYRQKSQEFLENLRYGTIFYLKT